MTFLASLFAGVAAMCVTIVLAAGACQFYFGDLDSLSQGEMEQLAKQVLGLSSGIGLAVFLTALFQ